MWRFKITHFKRMNNLKTHISKIFIISIVTIITAQIFPVHATMTYKTGTLDASGYEKCNATCGCNTGTCSCTPDGKTCTSTSGYYHDTRCGGAAFTGFILEEEDPMH